MGQKIRQKSWEKKNLGEKIERKKLGIPKTRKNNSDKKKLGQQKSDKKSLEKKKLDIKNVGTKKVRKFDFISLYQ